MARLKKVRFLLVYPLVAGLFVAAYTTEERLLAGIGLAVLGLMLRFWANGYVGHMKVNWTQKWRNDPKIGRLITAGPYAYVRHPLYLGTFLLGAGICVIVGHVWLSLVALLFFLVVYRRKMAQEEALIRDELGTAYVIYHASVPQWLPAWRRYPNRQGQWSWQGIRASREWKTIIWVVVILAGLYLREEALQEHDLFSAKDQAKHLLVLGLAMGLMLTDGVVELLRRRQRRAASMTV
jgi:protein-S-isoprenylcysteine O-methyltransferase Ste14